MRSRPRIVAVSSRLGGQRRLSNLYRAVVHSRALRTRHALCAVLADDEVRVDDALQHFYTQEYDESVRLVRTPHGRLEAARTRELLAAALPQPPARILDVGGGPGHHAQWMADQGYDVTLLDVVESHVLATRIGSAVSTDGRRSGRCSTQHWRKRTGCCALGDCSLLPRSAGGQPSSISLRQVPGTTTPSHGWLRSSIPVSMTPLSGSPRRGLTRRTSSTPKSPRPASLTWTSSGSRVRSVTCWTISRCPTHSSGPSRLLGSPSAKPPSRGPAHTCWHSLDVLVKPQRQREPNRAASLYAAASSRYRRRALRAGAACSPA
jgi:hypothetical protein